MFKCDVVIDCNSQTVEFRLPNGDAFVYKMEDQRPPILPSYEVWGRSDLIVTAMSVEEGIVAVLDRGTYSM